MVLVTLLIGHGNMPLEYSIGWFFYLNYYRTKGMVRFYGNEVCATVSL